MFLNASLAIYLSKMPAPLGPATWVSEPSKKSLKQVDVVPDVCAEPTQPLIMAKRATATARAMQIISLRDRVLELGQEAR